MNRKLRQFVLVALTATMLGAAHLASAQSTCDAATQECAEASQVGQDVQTALQNANGAGLNNLVLKKAVLTLETGSTLTGGVNITFLIFTIKHQTKKGNTITQEITWGALPKAAGGGATNFASLTGVLSRAIATAAKVASNVTQLPLTEATIKIQFVVDKDTGGSLSYQVAGVNLGPSVDFDKTSKNTLEVTFSK
jgi:hypothetical protein